MSLTFPHTQYPILALTGTVPRPSLSTSRERTLSLQGGCDVDRYQEGDDRVGDASEYTRAKFEDEGHKNSDWNLYSGCLIILQAGIYDLLYIFGSIRETCRFGWASREELVVEMGNG